MQYVVPGYVCYILFRFTTSIKKESKSVIIISGVISYVLLSFVYLLRVKLFSKTSDTAIINSALATIIGIIFTSIVSIIYNQKWFTRLTVKLFHKTPHFDIWRDILDLEHGSNLKVFLKNKDYYLIGHHKNHEEKENDSWLALSAFAKFDIDTNQNYKDEPSYLDNDNVTIAIRFSDIEHIEIF